MEDNNNSDNNDNTAVVAAEEVVEVAEVPLAYYLIYSNDAIDDTNNTAAATSTSTTTTTSKTTTTAEDDGISAVEEEDHDDHDDDEEQQQQQQQQQQHDAEEESSIHSSIWKPDYWTIDDIERAEQLLKDNMSKCRIRPTTTKNDRKMKDADDEVWNQFYYCHTTNFFKDRHYLSQTFPNEFGGNNNNNNMNESTSRTDDAQRNKQQSKCCWVEVGCGVGNAMLPFLIAEEEQDSTKNNFIIHGIDFSCKAIALLKSDPRFIIANKNGRAFARVYDITTSDYQLPPQLELNANIASLLFCLSAIHPTKHLTVIQNVYKMLRANASSIIVFRDYGIYDEAQMKLGQQRQKMIITDDNQNNNFYYVKHDGTCVKYFTTQEIQKLFLDSAAAASSDLSISVQVLECKYICRKYRNRSTNTDRRRVWVQARFRITTQTIKQQTSS